MKKDISTFIRASISSISSAIIDLTIFTIICQGSSKLFIISIATIIARVISTLFNFSINKYIVFKSNGNIVSEGILFIILFITKMILSSILVWIFNRYIIINQTILKSIVDISLFFGSYYIQKKLIFH